MGTISSLFAAFSCGLLALGCTATQPVVPSVSVTSIASSSPNVTVVTEVNGRTTRSVVHAPYGIQTSVRTTDVNGKTTTEASTTPLSPADSSRMQANERALQQQMDQLFAQQQKLFDSLWQNFPSAP